MIGLISTGFLCGAGLVWVSMSIMTGFCSVTRAISDI